jgi:hypothetical protein
MVAHHYTWQHPWQELVLQREGADRFQYVTFAGLKRTPIVLCDICALFGGSADLTATPRPPDCMFLYGVPDHDVPGLVLISLNSPMARWESLAMADL